MVDRLNIFSKENRIIRHLKNEITALNNHIPMDFGGGCSCNKANYMATLISLFNLKNTADIGVYRGRSFFPQVLAHRFYSGGKAYGIDPYSNDDAMQRDRPDLTEELVSFAEKTDFESIYNSVQKELEDQNLQKFGEIIRKRSSDAVLEMRKRDIKFGLIHIDGNHDTIFVMQDVENYFPLLTEKAIVVLDDISWESVRPAYNFLMQNALLASEIMNGVDDFAVFCIGFNDSALKRIKNLFRKIVL